MVFASALTSGLCYPKLTMFSNSLLLLINQYFMDIKRKNFKNLIQGSIFKKNQEFTNICKICKLEFSDPERTKRHMIKAHSKPKREK